MKIQKDLGAKLPPQAENETTFSYWDAPDEDLFPGTIVFSLVVILKSASYESSDSASQMTSKKQAVSAVHPRACFWAKRVPGILQRVHPHAFGER
jgi:hypothetical protein